MVTPFPQARTAAAWIGEVALYVQGMFIDLAIEDALGTPREQRPEEPGQDADEWTYGLQSLGQFAMQPGQTMVVTKVAGCYGGYVAQLAKADGLRVIAASSTAGDQLVQDPGADVIVPSGGIGWGALAE